MIKVKLPVSRLFYIYCIAFTILTISNKVEALRTLEEETNTKDDQNRPNNETRKITETKKEEEEIHFEEEFFDIIEMTPEEQKKYLSDLPNEIFGENDSQIFKYSVILSLVLIWST